jgi:hypothetical protein
VSIGGGRRRPEVEEKRAAPLELGPKKIGAERGRATLYSAGDRGGARGGSWPGVRRARRCQRRPDATLARREQGSRVADGGPVRPNSVFLFFNYYFQIDSNLN